MTSLAVAIGVAVLLLAAGAVVLLRRALGQRKQLQRLEAELARLRQEAGRLDQDPLTGLGNRAALSRWLETPRAEAGWLVVCDLDDFKQLNDRSMQLSQLFRVELLGQQRRTDQVTEHDRELAAFGLPLSGATRLSPRQPLGDLPLQDRAGPQQLLTVA